MTKTVRVWDPMVRVFHWALVAGFAVNALATDDESALHEWLGYAILALIAARILWGLVGSRHARFSDFPPDPAAAMDQLREIATGRRRVHAGHSPLGAIMIYNLLLVIVAIGISGWMMTTVTFFGYEWVEELHEVLVTWAEVSVVLHVVAVIVETRRLGINLPKAMVTGYKTMPDDLSQS